MRIAFYTPNYPGFTGDGGIGSYTKTLAHRLVDFGHEVHVLTPGTGPTASDGSVRVHFTRTDHLPGVDRLVPGAGACWRVARRMRRLAQAHRFDVVEFPNWEGHGVLFQRVARVPVVVRLSTSSRETQQIDGLAPSRRLAWDVARERWLARSADALATHSGAHRRLMADELGLPPDRIQVMPLGIEVFSDFVRPPRPVGGPTVVYLGRLEHRKGTVGLLHAVPRVLQTVPDARFVLIGQDRPHAPGGRTHTRYLEEEFPPEVRRQVTLLGRLPQPDVDRWLQTCDAFVAPSLYESFGLIFLEAMRWGAAVVGTTAGGIPEIVENGRSGMLVRPSAPDELAAALVRLLTDPELQGRIGAAAKRRVEQEFSVDAMAHRAAEFYREVIGHQPQRPSTRAEHATA